METIILVAIGVAGLMAIIAAVFSQRFSMISNFGLEEAIEKTPKLFKATTRTLLISTALSPQFFESDGIKKELEETIKRGVGIKVLVDPLVTLDEAPTIKKWAQWGLLEVREAKLKLPHFMVGDERHIRLDKPHASDAKEVEAKIVLNTVRLGWKYSRLFHDIWNRCSALGATE